LAYPVNGHKKGLFYLVYFKTEGQNLLNIERDCALNEMILRQMVLKIHPKHVDVMLAIARDEHALALQVAPEPTGAEGDGIPGDEGEAHPRRGRRGAEEMEKVG
jgi:small subunit ribosomal protein S6